MRRTKRRETFRSNAQPLKIRLNSDDFVLGIIAEQRISTRAHEIKLRFQGKEITIIRDRIHGVLPKGSSTINQDLLTAIGNAMSIRYGTPQ